MGAFPFNVFCHFLMKCMPPSPYTPLPFVIVIKNKTKKQKTHKNIVTYLHGASKKQRENQFIYPTV